MDIKKDIIKVLGSNIINISISIIIGFLLPAFLDLEEYAYLKTFTLYIGYIGILHFGFTDGIYIKYGSKYKKDVDNKELLGERKFLFFMQFFIMLVFITIGLIVKNYIIITFAFCILPINMQNFYKFYYQSLGEFGVYSKIMILVPNMLLISNLIVMFILNEKSYKYFLIGNVVVYYIVFIVLEVIFTKNSKNLKADMEINNIFTNFKVGIFIMIANLSSMFFYSLDRWFVKLFLDIKDFAFYSFAISIVGLVTTLTNSITMTLYPYIAKNNNENNYKKIKLTLLIIGTLGGSSYFIFAFIINTFVKKYMYSLNIIAILFLSLPVNIVINALYINLYKINKQEKKYLFTVILMLIVSTLFNLIALKINKSSESIAIASTVSFFVWYLYSIKDFKNLKPNNREIIFLLIYISIYLYTTIFMNWILGLLCYLTCISILIIIFYKSNIKELLLIKNNSRN